MAVDTNGDWSTPAWLYDQLDQEFHFSLDAAASAANSKCINYFTKDDDALRQSWAGHTAWCNPPWDKESLGQFARKAYAESLKGVTTVCLVPYWKGYDWFDRYCVQHGQIRHVVGKVWFDGANGKTAAHDCVAVVFGPDVKGYTNGPSLTKPSRNGQESVVEVAAAAIAPESPEDELLASRPRQSYTLLSSVEPQPVEWLWGNRIPLGELTVFDGDPGTNKSSVTLDLAARVSTGRDMPDGTPGMHGGVVLIQAEDSLTRTVSLRAQAAGADLSRIAVLEDVTIPDDVSKIEKTVMAVQARLIIIDPLMCFVDANANKEQAVRRALAPLRKMAEVQSVAVVVVRHLNKSGGSNPLYRGGGSIGITASVRSGFLVAPSPDDEHLRVLAHLKSNLAPRASSLLFEPVGTETGVRIEWRGESDYTAADLLRKPKNTRPAMDTAVEMLVKCLANGPVEAVGVQMRATAAGISLRTLERAKAELNIVSMRKGFGPGSTVLWALSSEEEEEEET